MNEIIDETKCPLCGDDNACQNSAENKMSQQPCWCNNTEYVFPIDLVTGISTKFNDKACICASCAQAYRKIK
ncbi:MAG: cysteine-rich CWC family protein [Thiohalomonadales bacterium]